MALNRNPSLYRVTSSANDSLGVIRAAKIRNKGLKCKTCDGKVCVGRCRFGKAA
jgi:hypothetical protein